MQIRKSRLSKKQEAGSVEIVFYTDPLCCWSWALEPQWRHLRYKYKGKVKWQYRMGGMLPNWDSFQDPINNISRPLQMGPLWLEAKYKSGMPIHDKVWYENPPKSSYPACIAVKAAGMQSPEAAEAYLRRVREAIMLQGKDISNWKILKEIGLQLSSKDANLLDYAKFEEDLAGQQAREAFKNDLQDVHLHSISRFPTLTMRRTGSGSGVMVVGYRPFELLEVALHQVAPEFRNESETTDEVAYRKYWGNLTDCELQEALRTN